jgi:hypothetical protein
MFIQVLKRLLRGRLHGQIPATNNFPSRGGLIARPIESDVYTTAALQEDLVKKLKECQRKSISKGTRLYHGCVDISPDINLFTKAHMEMLRENPERVRSYFGDPRVKYAA